MLQIDQKFSLSVPELVQFNFQFLLFFEHFLKYTLTVSLTCTFSLAQILLFKNYLILCSLLSHIQTVFISDYHHSDCHLPLDFQITVLKDEDIVPIPECSKSCSAFKMISKFFQYTPPPSISHEFQARDSQEIFSMKFL